MKIKILILLLVTLTSLQLFGQAPIVYINFVSHNEPGDNLQDSSAYFASKAKCLQLANLMNNKGASWNLGTCDYFIDGALNYDNAISNANDVFETLSSPIFSTRIEIDPRTKNHLGRNAADAVSMINSCGGSASHNLSGFTYYSPNLSQIDWFNYQDTLTGNITGYKWKADILWGAGSIPAHTMDLDDWGVWKPDTVGANIQSSFYTHNPNRSLWYIGNGCLSKLDTLSNEQDFITLLRNFVDSLQNNYLPQNKFYATTITLGQDEFGPTLFNKISTICDSINSWGATKVKWATTSQKFTEFQNWQINTTQEYSQWQCGQATTGSDEIQKWNIELYPNPTNTGQLNIRSDEVPVEEAVIYSITGEFIKSIKEPTTLNVSELSSGIYLIKLNVDGRVITKNFIVQ